MYTVYALMCAIFGTTFLAIKIGVDAGAPPFAFAGTRFFAAGLLVLLAATFTKTTLSIPQRHRKDLVLIGTFMTAIMFGCLYWGERYISSSVAALLAATTPIMIGIVEWLQGQREGARFKSAGLLLSLLGITLAVLPALNISATTEAFIAVAVILVAEAGCVLGTMTSKKVLASGVNPFVLNGWQMLIGGTFLLLLSVLTESHISEVTSAISLSWLYLVLFGSLAGHGFYYWLVRKAGPLLPSTWTYISPILAQFVGYYVLSEYLSVYSFLGLSLVLLGIALVSRAAALESWLKKQYQPIENLD